SKLEYRNKFKTRNSNVLNRFEFYILIIGILFRISDLEFRISFSLRLRQSPFRSAVREKTYSLTLLLFCELSAS
ncbi:MAG: hypothetical protein ACE5IW_11740, partial [bacterium]